MSSGSKAMSVSMPTSATSATIIPIIFADLWYKDRSTVTCVLNGYLNGGPIHRGTERKQLNASVIKAL